MNRVKRFYLCIMFIVVALLASIAVLGSLLSNNVGKDPDTVLISLPSLTPENEEATLDEWEYVSNMTLFGSNYGANKDKVIAPGMSNSVEIVVDNRNGGALDYKIDFNFKSGQDDFWIPLQVKITRYDGTLLTDDPVSLSISPILTML